MRSLLTDLASPIVEFRLAGYERARELCRVNDWQEARTPSWALTEAEAVALLAAVQEVEFPPAPPERSWKDGLHEALTALWQSPYPALLPLIEPAYARLTGNGRRSALLALLGILGTREAAEAFARCLGEHGWPERPYGRVFEELIPLLAFPDVLLPDLITTAGPHVTSVGGAVLAALTQGLLPSEEISGRLEALAPFVLKSLRPAVRTTAKHQEKPGIAWRFAERYQNVRHRTCMFLDLAGYLRAPKLSPVLQQAAGFRDPRIVTYALLALLRRGEEVPAEALETAAAAHETRDLLFRKLEALGAGDRFPEAWRTREAFAASAMADWLLYPTELGREPDELILEHVEPLDPEGTHTAYVWRYRVEDGPWLAGASGPHAFGETPGPAHGALTFSRFEPWESATVKEHLERCMGTAGEILGPS
jgi:hypothetical protein